MTDKPRVLIAGAGLGGLTAALALLKLGFPVEIFEQAPALGEVGAGVQISANGTRVLYQLGLAEALERVASSPTGKELRLWDTGETWPLFDLGAESVERYGYPYLTLHRADLHEILVDAVMAQAPSAIHLNTRAVECAQDGGGVRLLLDNGDDARGDVLIGADGVHSAIRQALFGPDQPEFTGCIAWRGIIDRTRLPGGFPRPAGTNWVGPGGHCVHYHLRRGQLVNFVGIRERDDWLIESWTTKGTHEECLTDFDGWHEDVRTLVRNIEVPHKWALMVRQPMDQWTVGRITLMGDACHSTLPFLAQGAVMAIEDGFVLARCLDAYQGDIEQALGRYEEARRERANRMVRGSAANTNFFHNKELGDRKSADAYMEAQWQPEQVAERYEWLFTYDATTAPI